MNLYQKHEKKLFLELTELFDNEGIEWFVSGRSALRAMQGGMYQKGFLDTEVMIHAKDAGIVMEALKDKEDRRLEGMHNNPLFPFFCFRYSDPSTSMIRMNDGLAFRYQGIFITISFLRCTDIRTDISKAAKTESLLYDTSPVYTDLTGTTSAHERMSFENKRKKDNFTRDLFFELCSEYSCDDGERRFVFENAEKELVSSDTDPFCSLQAVESDGMLLWIPREESGYYEKYAGVDWKKRTFEIVLMGRNGAMTIEGANNIVSTIIPYDEMISLMKKEGYGEDFFVKRQKNIEVINYEKELYSENDRAWEIAKRAGDLWEAYDHYHGQLEKLKKLMDAGEWLWIRDEMALYSEFVAKYYEQGMSFRLHDDIHDIYMQMLKIFGETDYLDELKKIEERDEAILIQLNTVGSEDNKGSE